MDNYPSLLLDALRAVAPAAESHPTVVLWTPGPLNSAYFEHAFLARQMGVELVEPGDLVVRDAVCYMRTTAGLQRVHTIYRRLDDDFIDPLEFRPDSMLGVPGLVRAYRAGTVAIANAIGTGVADDKAIYYYVPGDDPLLPRRGADPRQRPDLPAQRRRASARTCCAGSPELVVKPTSESGGKGVFIGPQASRRRARAAGADDRGRPGPLHRPGARAPVDRADRDRAGSSRPATSTCARSRCSARRSGSSPAA